MNMCDKENILMAFFERRKVFAVMLALKLGGGQKTLVKVSVILLLEIKQMQVD